MSRPISPRRRRIVAVATVVACMGGLVPTLTRGHPYLADVIMGLMVLALVYAIREIFKLKRFGDCR